MKNVSDLDSLIDEATLNCYDEAECRIGFLTILQDNVPTPFAAKLNEKIVTIVKIDGNGRVIKVFVKNGKASYPVDILDLEINPNTVSCKWIAAYKKWENEDWD